MNRTVIQVFVHLCMHISYKTYSGEGMNFHLCMHVSYKTYSGESMDFHLCMHISHTKTHSGGDS